ncbi:MAG TPA: phosphotransferase, partial [Isosphaeraceae bacterium]|nr:phosphotransferase [Isosphaeraceae bacterium]
QQAAHGLGVAPKVLHEEPGLLVSVCLDARSLRPEEVRRPDVLHRLARELRTLHGGWREVCGMILFFGPLQTVLTYARTAAALGASRPKALSDWLADAQELAGHLRPFRPVLCHNDLLAANLLDEPSSGRIRLVDWEYSGMGHPLFDLANAASNADLDADGEVALLEAYARQFDPKDLCELRLLRVLSSLREALWAVIQTVASDLDFDYHAYAELHFDAYRARRSRLDLYALYHSH